MKVSAEATLEWGAILIIGIAIVTPGVISAQVAAIMGLVAAALAVAATAIKVRKRPAENGPRFRPADALVPGVVLVAALLVGIGPALVAAAA